MNPNSPSSDHVKTYLLGLQARIVAALEDIDGTPFITDSWQRPEGGGGVSRLIEEGNVFERGGVGFSHVTGRNLPPSAAANRPELAGRHWEAMGVSLVLHPRNPHAPTVHMNVRFFTAMAEGFGLRFLTHLESRLRAGFFVDCTRFSDTIIKKK